MNTEKDGKPLSQQQCSRAFTIFCGVCEYDEQSLKALREGQTGDFKPWKFHINDKNLSEEDILRGFNTIYYESFISSIFPDYSRTEKKYFNEAFASHTLRLTKSIDREYDLKLRQKGEEVVKKIKVDYLDLYLFPGNIAFYCCKCDFSGYTYDDITLLEGHIRNHAFEELSFISESLSILKKEAHEQWLIFGNKLKSFTMVELAQDLDPEKERNLLYDLATSSPVGSAAGEVPWFQPTGEYLDELWEKNAVNVFDNWKGMCLFDSFTGLFRQGALNPFVWENAYFNLIFLHSIYLKHYLFRINKKFYLEDSNKQKLEDEFYEFDKYFNLKQISFNFLPQIIYGKIRYGLDIEDELTQLQTSIERANNVEKSRRDKSINNVLTIIALLTVFSIIWDLSEWFNKIFFNSDRSYVTISVSLTIGVSVLLLVFLLKNYWKDIRKWRRRRF
jgi:hypothetical protein